MDGFRLISLIMAGCAITVGTVSVCLGAMKFREALLRFGLLSVLILSAPVIAGWLR